MADAVVPGASSVIPEDVTQNIDPRLTRMFLKKEALVGIQSTFSHYIEPVRPPAQTDNEFIFELPNTGSSYIDLKNTELYVRGCLKGRSGQDIQADEKVVVSNNFIHTLFESVTINIGHNQTEIFSANHPYKAYMRQLIRNDVRTPNLRNEGMQIEATSTLYDSDYDMGEGRKLWTQGSRSVEFLGKTLLDFFQTDGYLMPATPVRIKYRKSRDAFYVVTDPALKDQEYNFVIEKIALFMPCMNIVPALTPLLEMQTEHVPAQYEYDALHMKQFSVPQGTIVRKFTRIFEGKIPTKLIVGFFKQDAFSGQRDLSPFMTYPIDLRQISLAVNGVVLREINTHFENNLYIEAYRRLTDWMNATGKKYFIDYENFKNGYRYFCFNLLENCPSNADCVEQTMQQGYADISIQLGEPLSDHCLMLVFYESSETVEITRDRATRYIPGII